jgi:hypothetical protein
LVGRAALRDPPLSALEKLAEGMGRITSFSITLRLWARAIVRLPH